jgi:transcriptional regulator with XRE-family HTH domain
LELYANIKKFRRQNGWSQEELAKRAGYTDRSSIAKIEKGQFDLPQSKILLFAEIFGVTPSELMGDDGIIAQNYDEFVWEQKQEEKWRRSDFVKRMLAYYEKFNEDGQEHLLQTAQDMLQVDRFKKDK